jgi:hypothetical protein
MTLVSTFNFRIENERKEKERIASRYMPGVAIWFGGSIERLDRGSSPRRRGPVFYGGGGGEFESTITSSAFLFFAGEKKKVSQLLSYPNKLTQQSLEEEKKGRFPNSFGFFTPLIIRGEGSSYIGAPEERRVIIFHSYLYTYHKRRGWAGEAKQNKKI